MLNIYDEPLEKCKEKNMHNGSWDSKGKCSEVGGGVHQICVKDISKNAPKFSKKTGQSDWSDNRNGNNHCVCLGAWSLYNSKSNQSNKKMLKCDAIPKISLSKKYVSKFSEGWNKWNGLEVNGQIKDGIESLVENCYDPKENRSEKFVNDLKEKSIKIATVFIRSTPIMEVVTGIMIAILIFYSGKLIAVGELSVNNFFSFINILGGKRKKE